MILNLLPVSQPSCSKVYKKSPGLGSPCDKDTVILALYAKDMVNKEPLSKVTKTKEILSYIVHLHLLVLYHLLSSTGLLYRYDV